MWPISITISNLVQIDQELAEICAFVYFSRWRAPPSWIFKKCHFGPLKNLVLPKFGANGSRIVRDMWFCVFSKMAAATILNSHKVLFLTPDDTYVAHIYHRIRCGSNWSRIGRDMPFCVFSKMAAAAIMNFQKVIFWTLDDTCIASIYKHTKFGANRSRIG